MSGWRPELVQPCGTEAAYRRHLYRGEAACFTCRLGRSQRGTRAERLAGRDYLRSVREFRRQREAARQARIGVLLAELVAVLSELPLEQESWPNQYTKRSAA